MLAYVLIDFDGPVVVLELRGVLGHLQHALVRRRVALLALEEVGRLQGTENANPSFSFCKF